ncbi:hypothetical protein M0R45_013152 [Rubus argutus]|uniref:Uncharacterized protein n=1 Tax=Rubus argutus TaxID=59490 RepID=A0AAW1XI81_RUBAR
MGLRCHQILNSHKAGKFLTTKRVCHGVAAGGILIFLALILCVLVRCVKARGDDKKAKSHDISACKLPTENTRYSQYSLEEVRKVFKWRKVTFLLFALHEFPKEAIVKPLDGYGVDSNRMGVMAKLKKEKKIDGKKSRPGGEQYLVRWAVPKLHDIDALSRMVDPSLNGAYTMKSLSRLADIISSGIHREPEFRPPISEIVQELLQMI